MTSVGEEAGATVPVSVVREENQSVTVVQGKPLTLTATAFGSGGGGAKGEEASSLVLLDRKSTRLNSSHRSLSRMPSSA